VRNDRHQPRAPAVAGDRRSRRTARSADGGAADQGHTRVRLPRVSRRVRTVAVERRAGAAGGRVLFRMPRALPAALYPDTRTALAAAPRMNQAGDAAARPVRS